MYSIGKLAKAGGVGVETIRSYQRKGLLETPPRGDGIRRYGDDDVRRLQPGSQRLIGKSSSCNKLEPV